VTIDEFCERHPKLYHMATSDSLSQIRKFGLLSTQAILNLIGSSEEEQVKLRTQRRPELVVLEGGAHGKFTLRDQKPLRDAALEKCLDGMTVPEWYETLNSRVFMWASKDRVESLLSARAYKKSDQLLLTINSEALITRHFQKTSVSTINSGATLYVPVRRGLQTFVSLANFPTTKGTKPIVEVTVADGVPDMDEFILLAEVRPAAK
jgi:hypothetical protein